VEEKEDKEFDDWQGVSREGAKSSSETENEEDDDDDDLDGGEMMPIPDAL